VSARLLMVVNRFPKFSETFIVNKLLELSDRGWDVHVACNRWEPGWETTYPQLASRRGIRSRVHSGRDLAELASELRPDVIHFEFGNLAREAIAAVAGTGPKMVVSFRGPDLNFMGLDDDGFYADVWRHADALHFLGEDLRRRALRRGCPERTPHALISPALRPDMLEAEPREHTETAGTPGRPLRILSVGRLHWMKGHEHALQAVALLRDDGLEVEHRIVGGADYGEAERSVRFAVQDLGLGDAVALLGARPRAEVQAMMRWADVLLHAAVSEGFCNAVLEAQAMGVPVVCTDADGLSENVVDGETGYLVPRRRPTRMVAPLRQLAAAPELRARLGSAGRSRALSQFSSKRQIDRFERLYRDAMTSPPADGGAAMEYLRRQLEGTQRERQALDHELRQVARELTRLEEIEHIRALVEQIVPPGAAVAVVSRGDAELLELGERRTVHLPQAPGGAYAGHHPADSTEAIGHLEAARAGGTKYLLIPATASWWLDHYRGLRRHLEEHARLVAHQEGAGWIFAIGAAAVPTEPIRRVPPRDGHSTTGDRRTTGTPSGAHV
jgi:colanic acid/amylovoran biosynthesis glycosyltransferase